MQREVCRGWGFGSARILSGEVCRGSVPLWSRRDKLARSARGLYPREKHRAGATLILADSARFVKLTPWCGHSDFTPRSVACRVSAQHNP